jgi:hypothetical protein
MRFPFAIHDVLEDPDVLLAYAEDMPSVMASGSSKPMELQANPNCTHIEDVSSKHSPFHASF